MKKDNFFSHKHGLSKKIFYLKKCVNYKKSNLRQNRKKAAKTKKVEKIPKVTKSFKMSKKITILLQVS